MISVKRAITTIILTTLVPLIALTFTVFQKALCVSLFPLKLKI